MIHDLRLRPPEASERPKIAELLADEWGSAQIVSRGQVHDVFAASAIGAFLDERLVGLVTYEIRGGECEVSTLNARERRRGIGSPLLDAVVQQAVAAGCWRVWLITSNDNLDAVRFYQRRGLRLVAVHPGAIDAAREIKPTISLVGNYGIPIRDELELELRLDGDC